MKCAAEEADENMFLMFMETSEVFERRVSEQFGLKRLFLAGEKCVCGGLKNIFMQ